MSGPQPEYYYGERPSTAPDGTPCVQRVARPLPPGAGGGGLTAPYAGNIFDTPPPCPAAPAGGGGGGGGGEATPSEVAVEFWHEVPLAQPAPVIAPGRAITGKLAFLETRGQTHQVFTRDTPNGTLTIDAHGVYFVDWGDGSRTGPHAVEGRPWPDGQITHVYVDARTYDVVVTEHWTATWVLGSESGTLEELRTEGRISDFPAEQIQAVRDR